MPPVAPTAPRRPRLDSLNPPPPPRARKPKPAPTRPDCCDEPNIQTEDGSRVCFNCGTQIEEANIVADVTFEEDARGAATVQGGFIGENARHARTLGTGAYRKIGGGERDATVNIMNTGKRALNALCPRLGIPSQVQDAAQNLWNIAAGVSAFTTGRRTDEVIGACVFVACRRQKDNHVLLMDIAEIQKINVFRLGEVYKALCDKLYVTDQKNETGIQHLVDIEPLIQRYCRKLEFGPKTRDVATDAVRILKRMKRDWIVTGRHPAGLCGACIILAARMNNFRRTIREVVYVAKVADQTISLRVEEFRRTRASNLTVDQFREYGTRLKSSHDPPVLTYSSIAKERFEEKKRMRAEQGILRATAERETAQRELAEREPIIISDGEEDDDDSSRDSSAAPDGENEGGPRRKRQRTAGPAASPAATQQEPRFDADGFAIPALPMVDPELAATGGEAADGEGETVKRKRGRKKKIFPPPMEITPEELSIEEDLATEIDENLHDEMLEKMRDEAWLAKQAEEAEEALSRVQPLANQAREEAINTEQERRDALGVDWRPEPEITNADPTSEQLEAEFENDPEVNNCLLSEHESNTKEKIWVTHNMDWLRAQQEKELLKKMAEQLNPGGKDKNSKRGAKKGAKRGKLGDRSVLENAETPIETPADAASAMLKKRAPAAFSKFVDYEKLVAVYNPRGMGSSSPSSASQSRAGSVAASSRAASVAPSVAQTDEDRYSATPERTTGRGGLLSPRATQARNATQGTAGLSQREASDAPLSPPQTQAQPAAEADDEEHVESDVDNDYQSETRSIPAGGWADDDEGGEDWTAPMGEDEDADADYNRVVGGGDYSAYIDPDDEGGGY